MLEIYTDTNILSDAAIYNTVYVFNKHSCIYNTSFNTICIMLYCLGTMLVSDS